MPAMLSKLKHILKNKTEDFANKLRDKVITEKDLDSLLWEMEISLLENNVSLEVVELINNTIKASLLGKTLSKAKLKEEVKLSLRKALGEIIIEKDFFEKIKGCTPPYVILFIGFNGVGKTTTLCKIGKMLKDKGHSVVFAAGDTYRAAAIEQLEMNGKKLEIEVIKRGYGADSASVIFDAIKHAKSSRIDFVLADTSGRAHTNKNLLEELKKIKRVSNPCVTMLVIDATSGGDTLSQVKFFEECGFDGYAVTKFDADSRGGTFLNICYASKKPIFFVGTGQGYDDIKPFRKEEVINHLLDF